MLKVVMSTGGCRAESTGAPFLVVGKRWQVTGDVTSLEHWRSKKVALSS